MHSRSMVQSLSVNSADTPVAVYIKSSLPTLSAWISRYGVYRQPVADTAISLDQ